MSSIRAYRGRALLIAAAAATVILSAVPAASAVAGLDDQPARPHRPFAERLDSGARLHMAFDDQQVRTVAGVVVPPGPPTAIPAAEVAATAIAAEAPAVQPAAATVQAAPAPAAQAPAPAPAVEPAPAAAAAAAPAAPAPLAGTSGCPAVIAQALGTAGCMISYCESGWNPNATGGAGEMGYFQVHPAWHADATYDPAGNVAAAARISGGGSNWGQWSVASVLSTGVCPNGKGAYPG